MDCRAASDELKYDRLASIDEAKIGMYIEGVIAYLKVEISKIGVMEPHIVKAENEIKECLFDEAGNPESMLNAIAGICIFSPHEAGERLAALMDKEVEKYARNNFWDLVQYVEVESE